MKPASLLAIPLFSSLFSFSCCAFDRLPLRQLNGHIGTEWSHRLGSSGGPPLPSSLRPPQYCFSRRGMAGLRPRPRPGRASRLSPSPLQSGRSVLLHQATSGSVWNNGVAGREKERLDSNHQHHPHPWFFDHMMMWCVSINFIFILDDFDL